MNREAERESRAWSMVAALARVTEHAHTEATLCERAGEALGAYLPGARVRVTTERAEQGALRCALDDGRFVELVCDPQRASARWDAEVQGAVLAVLRAGFAQAHTLARTAALSRRAHGEREELRAALEAGAGVEAIVARSEAMRSLVEETVPLVAAQDVTVLLTGETGAGKEVIARRVHALSRRAKRPFVKVNCAALPETLAESTLFGHERGAFTGAVQRHAGVFERAHGGTLLLDEVAELSPAMQARLLRVLQEREFERVGGTQTVRTDVRVLAATHRALDAMVRDGLFRADLYYRLAVVPLEVPPLRERLEDLDELVAHAVARLAKGMGRAGALRVEEQTLERLRAHPWPGNVRELENVLARSIVLSQGETLALPKGWGEVKRAKAGAPEAESFDDAQRRVLRAALEASGGRVYGEAGAAARLGLAPTSLQAKLARLGIKPGRVRK